jgi:NAD(P)-dependent dehydrogenase (short-subunit alcohol dehydrogenase family)
MQKILIFGATSAIASACARRWIADGAALFLVGRNPDKLDALVADLGVRSGDPARVHAAQADLDDTATHPALFECAVAALGGLDIVLIAQGTLPDQAACAASAELSLKEIHTNALAPISLMTLAANRFDAQGHGALVVIGSVAGDRGRQSNYVYGAAKGMLALFMQGLRHRFGMSAVQIVTVKPGFVDTPMTAAFDKSGFLWAQPDAIAAGILAAIRKRRGVAYLPGIWFWIMWVIRSIPDVIFKRLKL